MKKYLFFFVFLITLPVAAQTDLVFVYFKDKPNKALFYANPTIELSQKSLNRRIALGIPLNDQDAPIEQSYLQNIQNLGFSITDYSKWLNGVAVKATAAQIAQLETESYVASVENFAKNTSIHKITKPKAKFEEFNKSMLTTYNYGSGAAQIDQINLRNLHVAGYNGTGITIAVIDTGFPTVDVGSAFSKIRENGQILGGYNFVTKNTDIYNTTLNGHGTICLGAIAGYIDGTFVGSAPEASFYLYCSETTAVEIPEEEIYWIEAAEEADRKGVDLISSSLGYYVFDESKYDYSYADMTGQKSFISRGAQIATEKGIFVTVAMGNEAQTTWHYLITPADNAKVFSVGAVDINGNSSTFSSYGPNYLGVIKPDGSTRGTATETVYNNALTSASGTSLATPVAAGGVACLLQALPNSTSRTLVHEKLRKTASLYPNNTEQMGNGILNFGNALTSLLSTIELDADSSLSIYPNPTKDFVTIKTKKIIGNVSIYDSLGRLIANNQSKNNIVNFKGFAKGIYYLKIEIDKKVVVKKVIKE